MVTATETFSQSTPQGAIRVFALVNSAGHRVELSNVGAGITAIVVPDRSGVLGDITLGYADYASYIADGACAGKTPGRFANRIANARFALDGTLYHLDANDGPNSNHGGFNGFQNRLWQVLRAESGSDGGVVAFELLDPDMTGGYPGNLRARVTYTWTEASELRIEFEAVTDAPTVVNLTNHVYFNLGLPGEDAVINDHLLCIDSRRHLNLTSAHIPTNLQEVEPQGPFDFTAPRPVGHAFASGHPQIEIGRGYNHAWALPNDGSMHRAATLHCEATGRTVEVLTNQPAILLYTGGWLDVPASQTKTGFAYGCHAGLALECQGYPDAPSRPEFPSPVLRPGEVYKKCVIYKFSNTTIFD